jgi:hypothetical protein
VASEGEGAPLPVEQPDGAPLPLREADAQPDIEGALEALGVSLGAPPLSVAAALAETDRVAHGETEGRWELVEHPVAERSAGVGVSEGAADCEALPL